MGDDDAIQETANRMVDAFNRGDAKAYTASLAADADYIDSFGNTSKGRDRVEQAVAALIAGPYADARLVSHIDNIRYLTPTLAFIDFTSETTLPQSAPRKMRGITISEKRDGQWTILATRTWLLATPA